MTTTNSPAAGYQRHQCGQCGADLSFSEASPCDRCTEEPAAQPPGAMEKVDFSCQVCGVQCAIAPDPPERAVCPEHCEDHNYTYSREDRGTFCEYCWQEAPHDYYLED